MASTILDNLVDGKELEAGRLNEGLAVSCLAHAWGPGDNDIGLRPHGSSPRFVGWAEERHKRVRKLPDKIFLIDRAVNGRIGGGEDAARFKSLNLPRCCLVLRCGRSIL